MENLDLFDDSALTTAAYISKIESGFFYNDTSNPNNKTFVKHCDSKSIKGVDRSSIAESLLVYENSQTFINYPIPHTKLLPPKKTNTTVPTNNCRNPAPSQPVTKHSHIPLGHKRSAREVVAAIFRDRNFLIFLFSFRGQLLVGF